MSEPARRPAVRLLDVANAAGVHTSTVSRALNPETRALLAPETAARIEEAAARLGYVPNYHAAALRTRSSLTIGLLAAELASPLLAGADHVLRAAGYMMIAAAAPTADAAAAAAAGLLKRRADGFIVAGPWPAGSPPQALIGRTPAVSAAGPAPYSVYPDLELAAAMAAGHLKELGHLAVACVSAHGAPLSCTVLAAAARGAGLAVPGPLEVTAPADTTREGRRRCAQLLSSGIPFTGVLAGSDILAAGCCAALASAGRPCPAAVSVVGAGDLPLSGSLPVPLTTVRLPLHAAGAGAGGLLLARLRDPGLPELCNGLAPVLIARGSAGRAGSFRYSHL